ncbi:MAG: GNAT family N-acetyltransferase [Lachnospiraceae bacterium]|nr:GNAT family N-acetyltransferase [Lachnospiraceae bacterium]
MDDKRILSSGSIVFFTDDPEAAKRLAVSGSCFISLPEVTASADGYVRACEDFEDLSDAYLERLCMRHLKKPAVICRFDGFTLRECCRDDYFFVRHLFADNESALEEFDPSDWPDTYEGSTKFESALRDHYRLFDFGMWILENGKEKLGIFGLAAKEYGIELYYLLDRKYRGQQIAKRTCEMTEEFAAAELCAGEIYIRCDENNKPSRHLAEGLGFKLLSSEREGSIRKLKFVKKL